MSDLAVLRPPADELPFGDRTVRLLYTLESLAHLEERFGSPKAIQDALAMDPGRPVFGPLVDLVHAGLLHEDVTRQQVARNLPPAALRDYLVAVERGLTAAFGALVEDDAADAEGNAPKAPARSGRGRSGSTSRPSPSAAASGSSGA